MDELKAQIKKLESEKEELEFTNMFLSSKCEELEGKRKYYRKDREEKKNNMKNIWFEKETLKQPHNFNLRLTELFEPLDIHKEYDAITKEFKRLKELEQYILQDLPYEWWSDKLGGSFPLTNAGPFGMPDAKELLSQIFTHMGDGQFYENIEEELIEDWCRTGDIPEGITSMCVELALEECDVYTADAYDEVSGDKDDYLKELYNTAIHINSMIKSIKGSELSKTEIEEFKVFGSGDPHIDYFGDTNWDPEGLSEKTNEVSNDLRNILITAKLRGKAYDGVIEVKNDNEKDIFDMLEVIQTKNEEVAENDIKRVEEIVRLKNKVNQLCRILGDYEKNYIQPNGYQRIAISRVQPSKEYYQHRLTGLLKGEDFDIVASDALLKVFGRITTQKVNEMLLDENTLLHTEVWVAIRRFIWDNYSLPDGVASKPIENSMVFSKMGGMTIYQARNIVDEFNRTKKVFMLGSYNMSGEPIRKDWTKDTEEVKEDIHNY